MVEPFGLKARVFVNVNLTQPAVAGVDESVWDAGRSDHDFTRVQHALVLAERERRFAFEHHEYLSVGVAVKLGPRARLGVDHDHRYIGADLLTECFEAAHGPIRLSDTRAGSPNRSKTPGVRNVVISAIRVPRNVSTMTP
jgi:hypothetical protein